MLHGTIVFDAEPNHLGPSIFLNTSDFSNLMNITSKNWVAVNTFVIDISLKRWTDVVLFQPSESTPLLTDFSKS